MTEHDFAGADAQALRAQWFRFLDAVEPVRGALHGYCLRLTSNAWDAEDLVQDIRRDCPWRPPWDG